MSALKAERDAEPEDDFAGLVSKHWQVFRLKDKATFNPSKSEINKLPEVCTFAPMEKLKTDSLITDATTITSGISGSYTYFKEEDILVAKVTPCFENRNIAIAKNLINGIGFGSSEINVVRVSNKANRRWFFYLFLSSEFIEAGASKMAGAGGLKRIPSLFLETFSFALPPIREQNIIAEYLDTKAAQIDRQIDLLGQKATQYGKLKQSLINETVTHGLDKSVPMKDSGVGWIGAVPKHWEIKRVLDVAHVYNGNSLNDTLKEMFSDNSIPCLPYIGTKDIDISLYKANFRNGVYIPNSEASYKRTPANSTLLCIEGGSAGKKMTFVREQVCFVNKLLCFAANPRTYSLYLHYFVRSSQFSSKFKTCLTGLKDNYWGVTGQQIRRFSVPSPPFVEQQEIAEYLDEKVTQIDSIITTINSQIYQLKDLRKALINDVVTGKIKVVSEEGQVV